MPRPPHFRRPNRSPFATHYRRVPGEGPDGQVKVMLIGERPGEEEARRGRPFIGTSGKYLDICLDAAAIPRKDIYITNLVKDFTAYGKPTRAEIARDHDELVMEILIHDPEIIGLVGGWSVEEVLAKEKAEMDKVHGVPVRVTELFGGELTYSSLTSERAGMSGDRGGWVVLPMLHPANAIYTPDVLGNVLEDVLTLGRLMDGEIGVVEDEYEGKGKVDYRIVTEEELNGVLY